MSRDPAQRIDDIIDRSARIPRFTAGMTRDQMVANELVLDAAMRDIGVSNFRDSLIEPFPASL